MAGNALEWVADSYDKYYYEQSPERNPQGPSSGAYRVVRGGSWSRDQFHLRATYRDDAPPDYRGTHLGFRCARHPPPSPTE